MRIALDFDGTFTLDPVFWNSFIRTSVLAGHDVIIVTMRHNGDEAVKPLAQVQHLPASKFIFTGRRAKKPFVEACGVTIDIWIDDNPHFVMENAS